MLNINGYTHTKLRPIKLPCTDMVIVKFQIFYCVHCHTIFYYSITFCTILYSWEHNCHLNKNIGHYLLWSKRWLLIGYIEIFLMDIQEFKLHLSNDVCSVMYRKICCTTKGKVLFHKTIVIRYFDISKPPAKAIKTLFDR